MVLDGNISNEKVTSDLKAACRSYLPQIAKKISEITSSKWYLFNNYTVTN